MRFSFESSGFFCRNLLAAVLVFFCGLVAAAALLATPAVISEQVAGSSCGFAEDVTYETGDTPASVAIGDLDGDLDLDLAVANRNSNDVSVLLNNGDGTFAADVTYDVRERPKSVVCGDLDGDLDLDLAVACRGVASNQPGKMSILLNNGDGTLAPEVTYDTGESPTTVAIGDLDDDSDLDLAVANRNSDTVSVLLNNGNGTFAPDVLYDVGGLPTGVAMGDLDGDDDIDLAVANNLGGGGTGASVLLNNGDGTFAAQVHYHADFGPGSVAIGDLDGDGDLDLAVAGPNGDGVPVLLNNGDGTFAAYVTYGASAGPANRLAMGDLDSDLDLDLAVTHGASDELSVLLNNGDGTFAGQVSYGTGAGPGSIAIGDLDGDLDLDLAVSNGGNNDGTNVSVLLNECGGSPTVVTLDSFTVTRGFYVSGDETSLASSDNVDLALRRLGTDAQSRTEFEVKSTSPTASPTSFEFTLEGAVFARSNVVQTIELFDYDAASWELVSTTDAARSPAPDLVVIATATGDLSRFVEAGTMCIEARIHFHSDSPRQRFASNTDQTVWTIE